MLGRSFLVSLCAMILLWSSVAVQSTAAPLGRHSNGIVERDLVPLVEGDEIPPVLVDLQDQVENFQLQLDQVSEGEPGYVNLVEQLVVAKAKLDRAITGIAVFVSSTPELPAETISSETPTSPSEAETASETSTSTADPAPTSTAISDAPTPSVTSEIVVVPEETAVTPAETSIVVIASQAATSEIPVETIVSTQPQSGTVSSPPAATGVIVPAPAPAPGRAADTTINDSVPQSTSKLVTASTGKVANSSIGQSQSGALSLAPKSTLTVVFGASLMSMLFML